MPDPINLSAVFGLPPEKAIEYFQAKGYAIGWDWREVWQESQARAFTVAKVMRADILETIRSEVQRAIEQGMTERDFIRNLTPRLQTLGWWGEVVNPDTGEIGQGGSPRRLKTIFRTNLQTAFMAGRYRAMKENTGDHPGARNWWMYSAVMDDRTRPAHAALNGRVFRHDDPIWDYLFPPNGFGCRCIVIALTDAELAERGLVPSSSAGYLTQIEVTDPQSGITRMVASIKLPGMEKAFAADPGWSYNPGQASFGNDVEMMRKITAVKSREVRVQAVQAINNSELRHQEFATWAEKVLAARRPGNTAQVVGFVSEDVADFALARSGTEPARVLALPEKRLIHADSAVHQADGIALTLEEYQRLPQIIADPSAVYWDKEHGNLVYVLRDDAGGVIYIPVDTALNVKKAGRLDAVVNAYRLPPTVDGAGRLETDRYVRMGEAGRG